MKLLFVDKMNVAGSQSLGSGGLKSAQAEPTMLAQMAEALVKKFSGRHEVRSACFDPGAWEGEKLWLTKYVWRCLEEIGCDVYGVVVEKLHEALVTWADVVVVLEADRGMWSPYLQRSSKVRVWEVKNLSDDDMGGYREVREEIARKVKGLLREFEERLGYA